jgi:hypothetical protein
MSGRRSKEIPWRSRPRVWPDVEAFGAVREKLGRCGRTDQGEERVVEGDRVQYGDNGQQPGALAAERGSDHGKEELATIVVAQ